MGAGQQLPVSLPLSVLVVAVGLAGGSLVVDRGRARLYAVAVGALVALTIIAALRGHDPSMLSIGLIVAIYAFLTLRAPGVTAEDVAWVLDGFVSLMLVAAILGLVQLGLQYAGVPFRDWLAVVPEPFLVTGYNTSDPIEWDSPIHRVNGVVFLEPSFFSFFLGLAACVALHRGRSVVTVSLLLLAMVATLAGSGVVVLVIGCAALTLGRRRRNLRVLALPLGAAAALAAVTPIAERFLQRVTEVGVNGSSSSLRLVEPYQRLSSIWLGDAGDVLLGHGAGSAIGLLGADETAGLLVPVVPKLLLEYGAIGAAVFVFFLLWSLLHGPGGQPWGAGLLACYFVLNASLLQVTLALTTIVFVHLLREPAVPDLAVPSAAIARSVTSRPVTSRPVTIWPVMSQTGPACQRSMNRARSLG